MTAIITVLTILAAIPAVGFIVLYSRMPWWRSMVGRGVMILVSALTSLIGMGVLRVFLGETYPGRALILTAVYSFIVVGLWVVFIALIQVRTNPHLLDD